MIKRTLAEIERMAQGEGLNLDYGSILAQGVSIDSRTIIPGQLFVPIVRIDDGHRYVEEALRKGAAASLWQKDHPNPPEGFPVIMVEDMLTALQQLAAAYRRQLPVKVIAVTGSNGKTSTKDMLDAIFRRAYRVYKTQGNLNSQVGVPLTLLDINETDDFAIVEMGMSERGQIQRLSLLARPDAAIITMIGLSHLTQLGSREEIAAAKLEIVAGLKPDGALIINGDEPLLTGCDTIRQQKGGANVIRFGLQAGNTYAAANEKQSDHGISFQINGHPEELELPLLGLHHIGNALAAYAAADFFGLSHEQIAEGLRQVTLTPMRMERVRTRTGYHVINDAWNASPASMEAAIRSLAGLSGYRQKFLVLGDMLELGDREKEYHLEIGRGIPRGGVDYVYTLGKLGKAIAEGAVAASFPAERVRSFDRMESLAEHLMNTAHAASDVILIKGSRGMQMETLIGLLDKYEP
ncbi:UDP-N-acetylmuramoyl-tripeptide--D-alanyl-D-alanine ligase [Paenibacillus allorhizosphaerae]|uniref:UDP-N-acetylmuramoyl-tripeptide--D-alanyl-D-alanine ligase n=1 Tax=Paenibacillus allorhizosphaerae TaxID=2849866 RepID=A0ABN7TGW0_9BACL|nr:UDP-N-acetylmuramoyl-tripeptide--D-alanyl-D-alanine ligase [Paenibacillus allorhizosphaerae]CAG7621437.1 UDP-N-acetylmuramoyl-tripeptide--D-alanyl-D-alanine ligase [Paenibacillus allorhizosphaerae]